MNRFIIGEQPQRTPEQMIQAVTGVSAEAFIASIIQAMTINAEKENK